MNNFKDYFSYIEKETIEEYSHLFETKGICSVCEEQIDFEEYDSEKHSKKTTARYFSFFGNQNYLICQPCLNMSSYIAGHNFINYLDVELVNKGFRNGCFRKTTEYSYHGVFFDKLVVNFSVFPKLGNTLLSLDLYEEALNLNKETPFNHNMLSFLIKKERTTNMYNFDIFFFCYVIDPMESLLKDFSSKIFV